MPVLSQNNSPLTFSLPDNSFYSEVERRMLSDRSESFLYVVPNRVAQRVVERRLIEASKGKTISRANVLTLADLASELSTRAFPQLRALSDAETGVFIESTIRRLTETNVLQYFERPDLRADETYETTAFPIPRGTFELVVNTIRQLKESGITPDQMKRDLEKTRKQKGDTTEVRRASDIYEIFAGYEAVLGETFTDTYGQFLRLNGRYEVGPMRSESEAVSLAAADLAARYPGVADIFVEGFTRLETPSVTLLTTLSRVPGLRLLLSLESEKSNPNLFGNLLELEARLGLLGFKAVTATEREEESASFRSHAAKRLFSDRHANEKFEAPFIHLEPARSTYDEVEQIARKIKMIFERDSELRIDLSQIVVATPFVEQYTPLFQEVFKRHRIPVYIADRYHLDRSQLMMGLLALLDIARFGLRRREVIRALASPYFRFWLSKKRTLDARNLLEIVSRYRMSGTIEGWQKSLDGQLARLADKMIDAEDREREHYESEERRIRKAKSDLEQLDVILEPLKRPLRPGEFCKVVRSLLTRLEVGKQLLVNSESTIETSTLEQDTRGYRAFVKLVEDLETLFTLMGKDRSLMPLNYYVDRLKAAAIWTRFNPRPRSGSVLVTSLEQAIGQSADYMFLGGLTEGSLPSLYEPQVFLMGSLQRGERNQLLEERLLFYRGITNFRKELYLSYPERTDSGSEQTPSIFIAAVKDIAAIDEQRPGVPIAPADALYSYRDLYLHAADILRSAQPAMLDELLTDPVNIPATAFFAETLKHHTPVAFKAHTARSSSDPSEYRGQVTPEALTEEERRALEANRTRVWSVTQLETFASCGFKYFAGQVLRLDALEEASEGLDARDQGTILHEVLREFMTSRRDRKLKAVQDIPEEEMSEVYEEAVTIAERHLATAQTDHPFWRLDAERLLGDKTAKDGVLWKFIQKEQSLSSLEVRPSFFEVSFGSKGGKTGRKAESDQTLSQDDEVVIEGIKLRGKIDRIDIAGDHFTIVDYKSGKRTGSWKDIERGRSLQLALYLKVAEDLLRSHIPELKGVAELYDKVIDPNIRGVAALYHKVMDPESKRALGIAVKDYMGRAFEKYTKQGGLLASPDELRELVEQTIVRTREYVDRIARGEFNLTDQDMKRQCDFCDYRTACRVKEAEDLDLLHEYVIPQAGSESGPQSIE